MDLKSVIRDVPDFPKKGIVFKDITTLVADPKAFRHVLDTWEKRYAGARLQAIVGIESRGFIFAAALADRLGVRFIPARKPGKLPYKTIKEEYELEYGKDSIEMHVDAIRAGENVLVVDDLLATGGTARAAAALVEKLGGKVHELAFVIELAFIPARTAKLGGYAVHSLVSYDSE
jgi:adenine phosphoribosyltransferase